MPMSLSEIQKVVEDTINHVLNERNRIDQETHSAHHEWIRMQMEREKKKIEMYERIGTFDSQWAILAILGVILTWVTGHKVTFE